MRYNMETLEDWRALVRQENSYKVLSLQQINERVEDHKKALEDHKKHFYCLLDQPESVYHQEYFNNQFDISIYWRLFRDFYSVYLTQETKDLALYIRIARNHFSRKQPIRLIEHPNWDENIARRSKKDGYGFNWPPEYWNNEKTQMVKNLFEEVESLFIKEFRAALEYECALGAIRKDLIDHNVVASDGRSVSKSLDDLLNFINDNHVMTCITAQFIQDHFEKKLTSKDRKFSLRSIQDAILKLGN